MTVDSLPTKLFTMIFNAIVFIYFENAVYNFTRLAEKYMFYYAHEKKKYDSVLFFYFILIFTTCETNLFQFLYKILSVNNSNLSRCVND